MRSSSRSGDQRAVTLGGPVEDARCCTGVLVIRLRRGRVDGGPGYRVASPAAGRIVDVDEAVALPEGPGRLWSDQVAGPAIRVLTSTTLIAGGGQVIQGSAEGGVDRARDHASPPRRPSTDAAGQ